MAQALRHEPLDERLVEVALEILHRDGVEGLSLRRIARAAGVSHGAPLRHFRGLSHLRAEVAARGFRLLTDAVDGSANALPPGTPPLERLAAAGRAYVETAVANPGLFALMFRPEDLDVTDPVFQRESETAFDHLLRLVRAAQDAGWHAARETRVLAGAIWAGVHGLASLWAQGALMGPLGPEPTLDEMISTSLELVLAPPQGA
jgi:AcrR family transcriptional regulator